MENQKKRFTSNLEQELGQGSKPITIYHYPGGSNTSFSDELSALLDEIVESSAGKITKKEDDHDQNIPAKPALVLDSNGQTNINYLALPEGPEESPFVDCLKTLAGTGKNLSQDWVQDVFNIKDPAELWVFIARSCPHCPMAARTATQLGALNPRISVTVIDSQVFEDLAKKFNVLSVPTTILDQGLGITGVLTPKKLSQLILSRNSTEFHQDKLNSFLENKRLADATNLLLSENGSQAFVGSWKKSTTSSRMGLFLVVEQTLMKNAAALDSAVLDLIPLLQAEDAAMRGDTADLLGQIGHPAAIEQLQATKNDPNPDVAEIAADSIEAIEELGRKPN